MKKISHLPVWVFLYALLTSACGAPTQPTPITQPFVLITSAPNASPTPTPFQPSLATPTQAPLIVLDLNSTLQQNLPTATFSPPATPQASPTATAQIELLFPTQAAPPAAQAQVISPSPLPALTNTETINFLLIGSDRRPAGTSHRTDTLLIAIVWYREGQVSLISIPRDTWLYIPNVGMDRINTAFQYGEFNYAGGGMALLKETILQNFGIRIDHTAMVEFDGFRRVVDTLGGIDVPVSCPYTDWRLISPGLDENNEDNWWLYTVGPGQIHMDGDLALWYARSRSKSSDFDRGRRQQEVIRTLTQKALQPETLGRLPQLYQDFSSTVLTDMSLGDILSLAPYAAANFTNANIRSYYIRPPYVQPWTTPGGAAVLLPQESLNTMLLEASTLSPYAAIRETITVEIQNGSQTETLDALAASRLNYAGFETILSPADNRTYSNSVLVDLTTTQDPTQRQTILNTLGVHAANILAMPDPTSKVQYRLILGSNYETCFKPEDLSH